MERETATKYLGTVLELGRRGSPYLDISHGVPMTMAKLVHVK